MNLQKVFVNLGIVLIICSGAIIFYLTKDMAQGISYASQDESAYSYLKRLLLGPQTTESAAVSINQNSNKIIDFSQFKDLNPELLSPSLALYENWDQKKGLSLKSGSTSQNIIKLKKVKAGENPLEATEPAKVSDLIFKKKHSLISELIAPEDLLGKRTTIFLQYSFDELPENDDIQEPFAWGDCSQNRFFVHFSRAGYNFHFGPPDERLDVSMPAVNFDLERQLLVIDLKNNGTENEKNLYFNNLHLGKVATQNSKAQFADKFPLYIGSSECRHLFNGKIHKIYFFKDLTDEKLFGISKFLLNFESK
jgi:hypothetical protein